MLDTICVPVGCSFPLGESLDGSRQFWHGKEKQSSPFQAFSYIHLTKKKKKNQVARCLFFESLACDTF